MTNFTGDPLGDFRAELPAARADLSRFTTDQLDALGMVARLCLARLQATADLIQAELNGRSRESRPTGLVSDALDAAAAARFLGVSKQWLYRASRANGLLQSAARKVGRRVVYDPVALSRWRDRRRAG